MLSRPKQLCRDTQFDVAKLVQEAIFSKNRIVNNRILNHDVNGKSGFFMDYNCKVALPSANSYIYWSERI